MQDKGVRWVAAHPGDAAEIAELVEMGASVHAIASSFGFSMEWAWARVKWLGLTKKLVRRPPLDIELEKSQEKIGSVEEDPRKLALAVLELLSVWGSLVLSLRSGELLASVPGSAAAEREDRAGRVLGVYSEGIRFPTIADDLQFFTGKDTASKAS